MTACYTLLVAYLTVVSTLFFLVIKTLKNNDDDGIPDDQYSQEPKQEEKMTNVIHIFDVNAAEHAIKTIDYQLGEYSAGCVSDRDMLDVFQRYYHFVSPAAKAYISGKSNSSKPVYRIPCGSSKQPEGRLLHQDSEYDRN